MWTNRRGFFSAFFSTWSNGSVAGLPRTSQSRNHGKFERCWNIVHRQGENCNIVTSAQKRTKNKLLGGKQSFLITAVGRRCVSALRIITRIFA